MSQPGQGSGLQISILQAGPEIDVNRSGDMVESSPVDHAAKLKFEDLTPACPTRPLVLHARVVTGTGGGPEKTILNSPRFLKSLGYDCACAYMHPAGDPGFDTLRQRAADLDAELLSLPDRGATDLSVVRRLLRLCRERQVAVWHGHDHKSNAIGLLLRRFHPMA